MQSGFQFLLQTKLLRLCAFKRAVGLVRALGFGMAGSAGCDSQNGKNRNEFNEFGHCGFSQQVKLTA